MTTDTAEDGALFGVTETRPTRPGEVAATFRRLVDQAIEEGKLVDEDGALVAGVAVLAEALDTAHRVGGMKGGYLAAQAFPPYQRGLHALRLPVELTAATPPAPAAAGGNGQDELTAFLRDLGTAEP